MVPVKYMLKNFFRSRRISGAGTLFAFAAGLLAAMLLSCSAAHAQVAPFVKTDVNTGAAGSYSYSSPTYTVSGAGAGIGTAGSGAPGTTDGFTFASFPVSGNVEIVGKLTGQSGTGLNNFSQAGIMVRSTLASNSQMFFIGASPTNGNGINFHARTAAGAASSSTLGPAPGAAPVWLRLVVSGQNIAAFQSSDSTNWVLVGKATSTLPGAFYAGLAVSSNQNSTTSSATFENVRIITNVPQRSADMLLWLRSDDGLQSTDKLNRWLDASSNGQHATGTGTNRPTVSTNVISGSPVVQFTPGNSEFLTLPSGFDDFEDGISIYMVLKHAGSSARYILDLATGASPHDSVVIDQIDNDDIELAIGNSAGTFRSVSGNGFSTSTFQLLEATDSPYSESDWSTGNIYKNGTLLATNPILNGVTPATLRTRNELGRSYLDTLYYSGQLAELIIMNKEDSASARQQVERYCQSKYGFGTPSSTLSTPVISPSNRVLTAGPVTATITGDPGAAILYTTNGADPTVATIGSGTSLYTGSFSIASSTKVKAMSVSAGFTNSAIGSSDIQIDANAALVYKSGLQFWLRSDNGVVLNGASAVAKWYDVSGAGHVFEQTTGAKQPSIVTNQLNGLPAIDFPDSNNQCLVNTSNLHSWSGATMFMVVKPTDNAPSGTPRILDIGSGGTAQDNIGFNQPAGSDYRFFAYDGTTLTNCTGTGAFTYNAFQLIEATTDNATQLATVFKDGVQNAQTSPFSLLQDVTRSSNVVGANSASSNAWKGQIVEVICFNRKLSDSERAAIEGYLFNRTHLKVSAPIISPNIGMNSPTMVTLTADVGAQIFYTVDGAAPTTNPPSGTTITYTGPFAINGPTRVRAKARNFSTDSAESEAYIAVDAAAANVPRSGLQVWLRSDNGVVAPSGSPPQITSWKDIQSTTRNATATNNPTLLVNQLNGLPAVNLAGGSTQYFTNGGTFNFTGGFSAFIVSNITTPGSTVDIATFTQASPVRSVKIQATSTPSLLYSVTNSGTQTLTTGMTLGFPQVIGVVHSGGTATVFRNGAQLNSGSVAASTYSGGLTGQLSSSGAPSTQKVFEVLVFDRAVTAQERQDIEAYLMVRYGIAFAPVADPVFSIPSGTTFDAPAQISVAGPLNSTLFFTTDGSTPTQASTVLSSPLNISFTQTVRVIAVLNNVSSNVASATYTLDATKWPNPNTGGTSPPTINLQLPTTAQ